MRQRLPYRSDAQAPELPAYAHLPGINLRHRDGYFDQICASVTSDTSISELSKTDAWHAGIYFYEHEYFWEAHEVLEAVWMQCPPNSIERNFVQAFIQLANARLKLMMGKAKASLRIFALASELYREASSQSCQPIFGITNECFETELRELKKKITNQIDNKSAI